MTNRNGEPRLAETAPLASRQGSKHPVKADRFTRPSGGDKIEDMSTITAILEADADGTLHLPLPAELRHGRVEVTATLKAANSTSSAVLRATPDTVARRMAALKELRGLGGLRDVIPDPLAWQREMRHDR